MILKIGILKLGEFNKVFKFSHSLEKGVY